MNREELLRRIDIERLQFGKWDDEAYMKSLIKYKEGDQAESEKYLAISAAYSRCYDRLTEFWMDVWEGEVLSERVNEEIIAEIIYQTK